MKPSGTKDKMRRYEIHIEKGMPVTLEQMLKLFPTGRAPKDKSLFNEEVERIERLGYVADINLGRYIRQHPNWRDRA